MDCLPAVGSWYEACGYPLRASQSCASWSWPVADWELAVLLLREANIRTGLPDSVPPQQSL